MKKYVTSTGVICLITSTAHAGGIDRNGQGINILFEEGNVLQASMSYTSPDISGSLRGISSGNVGQSFQSSNAAFKLSIDDKLDFALKYDQPFGAHSSYNSSYGLSVDSVNPRTKNSLQAVSNSEALTGVLRYKFTRNFSTYVGVRGQRIEVDISIPSVAGYNVTTDNPTDFGYLVGGAWEKPEIAARVSLTYNSAIDHTFSQVETNSLGLNATSSSTVTIPQSINLNFQTGITPKTLLFGSIRWVDWEELSYAPPNYAYGRIVGFEDSAITYFLGAAQQLTEKFSGGFILGYEASKGTPVTDLAPTDGFRTIGMIGTYNIGKAKVSGGVFYSALGDVVTKSGVEFSGSSAWSGRLQVTYAMN